jgi:hypothetical protein
MQLQTIQNKIYEIRDQKVMLDFDLAELYEVETRVLNQSVKRNIKRFPNGFMFQLSKVEFEEIRSQIVLTSKSKTLKSQIVISKKETRGGSQKLPFAFTEQGVAMLSTVLRSDKAINVSIAIMKAFVFIRQYALSHKDLTEKLKELENRYDKKFDDVLEALNYLLQKDEVEKKQSKRKRIGFRYNCDGRMSSAENIINA